MGKSLQSHKHCHAELTSCCLNPMLFDHLKGVILNSQMHWRIPMNRATTIILRLLVISCCTFLWAEESPGQAPGFYLRDLKGQDFFASRVFGPSAAEPQAVVLSFFATWCIPCRAEAPQLEILAGKYPHIRFYLVSVQDSEEQILKWLDQFGIGLDVLVDKYGRTAQKYGVIGRSEAGTDVASLPSLFVINAQGDIIYEHTGYSPGDEKELDAILETLK